MLYAQAAGGSHLRSSSKSSDSSPSKSSHSSPSSFRSSNSSTSSTTSEDSSATERIDNGKVLSQLDSSKGSSHQGDAISDDLQVREEIKEAMERA
jgi:hypothetical protein